MLLGKGKRNTQIYPAGDLQREEQPNFPLTDQLAEPKGRVDFTFFFFFIIFSELIIHQNFSRVYKSFAVICLLSIATLFDKFTRDNNK